MTLRVQAYRCWIELKHFTLNLVSFIAYGANADIVPGPPLPPDNGTLKSAKTSGTYASRIRKTK